MQIVFITVDYSLWVYGLRSWNFMVETSEIKIHVHLYYSRSVIVPDM